MVSTFLSEEDQALKEQFEKFAQDNLAHLAAEPAKHEANSVALLEQLAQAGYLALNVPIEHGGKDFPFLQLILLAETLAHYQAGIAVYLAYHAALIELLKAYGSKQQQHLYLPKLAAGKLLGSIAYLEESKLEESQNDKRTKVGSQDGKLILSGSKELVVLADTETSNGNNQSHVSNLLGVLADDKFVLLDNLSAPSIKINAHSTSMESRSIYLSNLIFEKHSLKQSDILTSTKETTNKAVGFARNIIKTVLAAASLGMADSALNQTTNYVKQGQRAGSPLSESQAVLWKLADACADTSAARLLTYRAAWSKDEDKEVFSRHAAMAKAYAAQTANKHIGAGMQILLPFLQTPYFDLTCFYIDSKILETFDATNEEEKVLLSKLLGI